jgi:hypothetical protein
MSNFLLMHQCWIEEHIKLRKGENKRRLIDGHYHAEKEMLRCIWWPSFGHFRHLHPEYEITDFMGGRRYIDLAYTRGPIKIAIEVDGYGAHVKDLSRRQFCDQWVRQMHLINSGWIVVRIGYDDIKERPQLWQQLFQQMIGRLFNDVDTQLSEVDCLEREVVRLALGLGHSIKLKDVRALFDCGYHYARDLMRSLQEKQWFLPDDGGAQRVHSWKLNLDHTKFPF